jgi:hypothetical protein
MNERVQLAYFEYLWNNYTVPDFEEKCGYWQRQKFDSFSEKDTRRLKT